MDIVQDPVPLGSPSPSLSNHAEFSEEVSKLTNECSKTAQLGADNIFPGAPRIIFDNLTDDDTLCIKGNRYPYIMLLAQ